MDALTVLHERVSVSKLIGPAPTLEQRRIMIQAAVRAADHGNLRPWRFIFIEGDGLRLLGELFARVAASQDSLNSAQLDRFKSMPMRAPLIIVVVAKCQEHPKVPVIEQLLSGGAAAQNIITAAYALGLGALWRTGDLAYHSQIKQELGLVGLEQIIGFIYVGTPAKPLGAATLSCPDDFFSAWPQQ